MKTTRGMALIELLVYMGVLLVLMGVGYAAFYRCLDNSTALRQSADDIVNALHAGEDWRGDVRTADRRESLEPIPLPGESLHLRIRSTTGSHRVALGT